jgi:DNA-binding winged helix-turn-helix (wHTH) protein
VIYRFQNFEADEDAFELRQSGRRIDVQRRVLETIFVLLRSEGRLVTKEELIAGPWKGASVSDGALTQAIMLVRRALRSPGVSAPITTVRGKGIRFTGDVAVDRGGGGELFTRNIHSRFARFPRRTRVMLVCAAVMGPEFSLEMLCAATALPDDEVRAALQPALQHAFVRPSRAGADRFEFPNPLVQRFLVQSLSPSLRGAVDERLNRVGMFAPAGPPARRLWTPSGC